MNPHRRIGQNLGRLKSYGDLGQGQGHIGGSPGRGFIDRVKLIQPLRDASPRYRHGSHVRLKSQPAGIQQPEPQGSRPGILHPHPERHLAEVVRIANGKPDRRGAVQLDRKLQAGALELNQRCIGNGRPGRRGSGKSAFIIGRLPLYKRSPFRLKRGIGAQWIFEAAGHGGHNRSEANQEATPQGGGNNQVYHESNAGGDEELSPFLILKRFRCSA